MFAQKVLAALLLCVASAPVLAEPITLSFSGLQDNEPVADFYNGGNGGFGSVGGTNYGISFTSDSLAIISLDKGGSGHFANVPAPSTSTTAYFLTGAGDTMNVAGGFSDGFAFFYASPFYSGTVEVYSGLNGTGNLLASDTLAMTQAYCDSTFAYSCWQQSGMQFSGMAESVVFSGTANYIGFADITLGATSVPSAVTPEPSSLALIGLGLLSGCAVLRRQQTEHLS